MKEETERTGLFEPQKTVRDKLSVPSVKPQEVKTEAYFLRRIRYENSSDIIQKTPDVPLLSREEFTQNVLGESVCEAGLNLRKEKGHMGFKGQFRLVTPWVSSM